MLLNVLSFDWFPQTFFFHSWGTENARMPLAETSHNYSVHISTSVVVITKQLLYTVLPITRYFFITLFMTPWEKQ